MKIFDDFILDLIVWHEATDPYEEDTEVYTCEIELEEGEYVEEIRFRR